MTSAQPNVPTLRQLWAREFPILLSAYLLACVILVLTVAYTDLSQPGTRLMAPVTLLPPFVTLFAEFRYGECLAVANKVLTWRLRFVLVAVFALSGMLPHYLGVAICLSYATAAPCQRSDTVATAYIYLTLAMVLASTLGGYPPIRMKVVYRELTGGTSRFAKKCKRLYGIDVATLPWIVDKLD